MSIEQRLESTPVIPLIQASEPAIAVQTATALLEGGLSVIEVVMRTPEALECLSAIVRDVPDAVVGAGTVLSAEQAQRALDAGSAFLVSPGLDRGVVDTARKADTPIYPGVATPTEVQAAWNLGLRTLKFFPASLVGGAPMLKALGSVFHGVKFIPTGGVSAANLADFLALDAVLACGGSWLTPADAVNNGRYEEITALAAEAAAIAHS